MVYLGSDLVQMKGALEGSGGGGSGEWGYITGNIADQTDLQNALSQKPSSTQLRYVKEDCEAYARTVRAEAFGIIADALAPVFDGAQLSDVSIIDALSSLASLYDVAESHRSLSSTEE